MFSSRRCSLVVPGLERSRVFGQAARPRAETSKFLFPSLRFCIDSPTLRNSVRLQGQRRPKHSFLNFGTLAYFNEVLARFSEVPPTKYPLLDTARLERALRKYSHFAQRPRHECSWAGFSPVIVPIDKHNSLTA